MWTQWEIDNCEYLTYVRLWDRGFHWLGSEIPTVHQVWYQSNTGPEWAETTNYGHYFVWKMCLLFVLNNSAAQKKNMLVTCFVSKSLEAKDTEGKNRLSSQYIFAGEGIA